MYLQQRDKSLAYFIPAYYAKKVSHFKGFFAAHIQYPLYFMFSRLGCAGMNSIQEHKMPCSRHYQGEGLVTHNAMFQTLSGRGSGDT